MPNPDYDRGFSDGLMWVAAILRRAAEEVEAPVFGEFETKNGGTVKAISRVGQVFFARQLREVALTIEKATEERTQ